jgi:hypothetical protein
MEVLEKEGYNKVLFKGERSPSPGWVKQGWQLYGGEANCLPTFVAPIARERPPPRPAGLERCTPETIKRWEADEMRFPPYQYQLEAGLHSKDGRQ